VVGDFYLVRNGCSIGILISGSIFKLLLKNRSAFIENHFENRFQTKQSSPPTIREMNFGVTLSLAPGIKCRITFTTGQQIESDPRHQLSYLVTKYLFSSNYIFHECEKRGFGV
jgi:hypothetical protein